MYDVVYNNLKLLEEYLQKNVNFNIEHKTVRRGKLLLYNINDYYIKFTIVTNKDINKTYEVPFPYKISKTDTHIKFSYKIEDLCHGNIKKEEYIRQFEPISNKLYDKNLRIIQNTLI
jgi:hypothetical protein